MRHGCIATYRWELISDLADSLYVEGVLTAGDRGKVGGLHIYMVRDRAWYAYALANLTKRGYSRKRLFSFYDPDHRVIERKHVDTIYGTTAVKRISSMAVLQAQEEFYILARKVLRANPNIVRDFGSRALMDSLGISEQRKAKDKNPKRDYAKTEREEWEI